MIVRVEGLLQHRLTRSLLLLAHLFVIALMMWATRNELFGDHGSYLALAEGILHGRYSMWWQLAPFIPDTFRTPGFPLFIAGVVKLFGTWKAIIWIQLILYILSLNLMLRIVARFDPRPLAGNLALLLLLPLLNVPYYITQLSPEILSLATVTAAVYVLTRPGRMSWLAAIGLGLLYGFIFQCKPVYLWFPPLMAIGSLIVSRKGFDARGHVVALAVFGLTLLPYGSWNARNHGRFQITPLEGGGGVVHMGIWSGLIPGHQEHRYWSNFAGDEILRFAPRDSVAANIAAYEADWDAVMAALRPFLTKEDSIMLKAFDNGLGPNRTFNTLYTLERERLLKAHALAVVRDRPGYAIAYKSWSAFRLWVIGIQPSNFMQASFAGRMKMIYATASTLVMLVLTLVFVPMAYRRRRLALAATFPLLLHLLYFAVIHIPFVIQVRYTTPVRPIMTALTALAIASSIFVANRPARK